MLVPVMLAMVAPRIEGGAADIQTADAAGPARATVACSHMRRMNRPPAKLVPLHARNPTAAQRVVPDHF
jgi:hypothetical protein